MCLKWNYVNNPEIQKKNETVKNWEATVMNESSSEWSTHTTKAYLLSEAQV